MDFTNLRFPSSRAASSSSRRLRAAAHKARELRAVEDRLQTAGEWATRRNDAQRAAAYARQADAARRERLRWAQLARQETSSASPTPHITAALLCAVAPLIDAFMSSSSSSSSSSLSVVRFVGFPNVTMLIATVVTVVIVGLMLGVFGGSAKPGRDDLAHGTAKGARSKQSRSDVLHTPQHWASTIAQNELSRKLNSNPDLEFALRHNL